MRLYSITPNTSEAARQVGQALLEQRLAFGWTGFLSPVPTVRQGISRELVEEPEVVLIVKTQFGYWDQIEQVIHHHVRHTSFIAEIAPTSITSFRLAEHWSSKSTNALQLIAAVIVADDFSLLSTR